MAQGNCREMWFGPIGGARWIPTPNTGAEVGPSGWGDGGTFLSGGAYQVGSRASHREFTFEWKSTSSYEAAQQMSEFAAGTYGDGLMYFIPPTIYDKNVLPPQWASPATLQGPTTLIRGVTPTVSRLPSPPGARGTLTVPGWSVTYPSSQIPTGGRQEGDGVFIPVPPGYDLLVGFLGAAPTGRGVFAEGVSVANATLSTTRVPPVIYTGDTPTKFVNTILPGSSSSLGNSSLEGYRIWVGQSGSALSGNIAITALTARLVPTDTITQADLDLPYADAPAIAKKPWVGGMGHSGCRFVGKPTMILNTGWDGGTASYAASFREVGTWLR